VIDILKKEGTNTYLTEYSFVGYCNNICRCWCIHLFLVIKKAA
jgi:hypothetical protein